jgi:hypothetical protein
MASRVPTTSELTMASTAASRVFLMPTKSLSQTWEKLSLPGSTSGPHRSIENCPLLVQRQIDQEVHPGHHDHRGDDADDQGDPALRGPGTS